VGQFERGEFPLTLYKGGDMIRTYEHRLKGMTYILGSNCSDGVVLIGDRKVTLERGATYEYEDKLFLNDPFMVVGSSGVSGLFEKFRENLAIYIASPGRATTVPGLTAQIEVLTRELNEKYKDILRGQDFDVLLGIKTTANSELKYVYPFGFAEGVRKYKSIGHGEPYGSFFLRQWWRPNMTMLEVAELGFFIIKYIQDFGLDNTVGIGDDFPQVWLIPHKQPPPGANPEQIQLLNPHMPSSDEMAAMRDRVSKRLAKFKDIPWSI
jgi:20S proteasome alpha/beta subunit